MVDAAVVSGLFCCLLLVFVSDGAFGEDELVSDLAAMVALLACSAFLCLFCRLFFDVDTALESEDDTPVLPGFEVALVLVLEVASSFDVMMKVSNDGSASKESLICLEERSNFPRKIQNTS